MLMLFNIFFILQMFTISKEQHFISASVVLLIMFIFHTSRKIYKNSKNKFFVIEIKNFSKKRIFYKLLRNNNNNVGQISPKNDLILRMGIDMCITSVLSILIINISSQIVFVPMNFIESGISITMGIILYTLSLESIVVLPYTIIEYLKLKEYSFATK